MKLKRSLLCLLTAACLLLAAAAPALAEGTSDDQGLFSIGWMDGVPEVSDAAFNLARECYNILPHGNVEFVSVNDVSNKYGETLAQQYVGAINRFYDTGDTHCLNGLYSVLNGESSSKYTDYVPGSASPASAAPVTEAPFPDVQPDAWYAKAVSEMKDSGIIEGCDDGLFHPERPVTIGELYAMLLRAVTTSTFDVTVATGVSNDTHWANGVLENARKAYLWPPEMEHADDYALRGEAVSRTVAAHGSAMLSKYAQPYKALWTWTMTRERTEGNLTLADIPDHAVIEQYLQGARKTYENDIVSAYNYGITKGIDEAGTFNPYGTLTRAEAAQLLYNAKFTERTGAKPDGWFL